jgi:hypothetical protein
MSDSYWDRHGLYGVMAEFAEPEALLAAAERAYTAGYRKMDAYTPTPIEGLSEAIGFTRNFVSPAVLVGGLCGCMGGFSLLWWISKIAYAHNIAGRPFNSWPAYIPITFECTVLLASLTAFAGMFAMNGLPQPYHPVFNNPRFSERASIDRFFLCIEAQDPNFDLLKTKAFLAEQNPLEVAEVEK